MFTDTYSNEFNGLNSTQTMQNFLTACLLLYSRQLLTSMNNNTLDKTLHRQHGAVFSGPIRPFHAKPEPNQ